MKKKTRPTQDRTTHRPLSKVTYKASDEEIPLGNEAENIMAVLGINYYVVLGILALERGIAYHEVPSGDVLTILEKMREEIERNQRKS